ncbi:uncharacterized protein LOC131299962 [Rhododendron vialii]|uniref:uncharacterized protein LOC131299962 n=1 Tax=Rhododendron vialii TaxID=182163 RepID=UPI00265E9B03|nr:uncharacterized protein LOC131299962 [Rhododendron vialii]XP_058181543.1 uncharacterized protein LOC131299962 [Rhododendron vialii]
MEELIKTANIYYKSCSPAVRDAAHKFFKDIDHDNDGKVSLHEFLEFMRQEGHAKMCNRDFFKTLDKKRSGTLGFAEVLALFYIIQSGRPFCHGCDVFIAGMYFTCSKCYQSDNNNVIFVCPKCFEKGLFIHSHERNQFLDNYALLALQGKRGIARARTHSIRQRQVIEQRKITSNKCSYNFRLRYVVFLFGKISFIFLRL